MHQCLAKNFYPSLDLTDTFHRPQQFLVLQQLSVFFCQDSFRPIHRGALHWEAGPRADWQVQRRAERDWRLHPKAEWRSAASVPLPPAQPCGKQHHHIDRLRLLHERFTLYHMWWYWAFFSFFFFGHIKCYLCWSMLKKQNKTKKMLSHLCKKCSANHWFGWCLRKETINRMFIRSSLAAAVVSLPLPEFTEMV